MTAFATGRQSCRATAARLLFLNSSNLGVSPGPADDAGAVDGFICAEENAAASTASDELGVPAEDVEIASHCSTPTRIGPTPRIGRSRKISGAWIGPGRIAHMSVLPAAQVSQRDRARAISTIVSAFTHDPVERWLFPEIERYQRRFPDFVAAFAGDAFDQQTVWRLGDFRAVALWLPPGAHADEGKIVAVLSDSVAAEQHEDMYSVLEQIDRAHPDFPHWYLPWLGVVLDSQGSGLGGELLEHSLRTVDQTHLPAYLETPNPRTVSFYERYGFASIAESRAGACPPVISMLRPAH